MNKSTVKSTKRALLMSAISLFMCFSMLVGTTFAWFTDSVTSANNIITAGNLDIELYHTNNKVTDQKVGLDTALFGGSVEGQTTADAMLWEPGAMVWEEFTVANEGTLALKYQFSLNVTDPTVVDGVSFASMLKVAIIEGEFNYTRAELEALDETKWSNLDSFTLPEKLEKEESDTFSIVIWWKPSANDNLFNMNNDRQGSAASVTIGINLVATQLASESDSIDSDYDKDAWADGFKVMNADDLQAAISNGEDVITLENDMEANSPIVVKGEQLALLSTRAAAGSIVINLNGYTLDLGEYYIENRGNLIVTNGNIVADGEKAAIWNNNGNLVIEEKAVITGASSAIFVDGGSVEIAGGTLASAESANEGACLIRVEDGTLTINGGEFVAGNDAIIDAIGGTTTINGGEFSDFATDSIFGAGVGVSVTGGNFDFDGDTDARNEFVDSFVAAGYKGTENTDGEWVVTVAIQNGADLQEAIQNVKEGEVITLVKDIVFETGANGTNNGISHTSGISFTLDLNGHTVTSNVGGNALRFKIGEGNDVKDTVVTVTIKNGKVVSGPDNWCAISASSADNSGNTIVLNLEDLEVEASKAGDYAIKSWAGAKINATNVTTNTTYAGGFHAVGGEMVLTNCTAVQTGLHTLPYMSMAVSVSYNGKMTINSGSYSAAPLTEADGGNQGATHGSWVGGVMNSGGTLIINGGTFTNDNVGENSLATAARGLIFGDTYSKVYINGGEFNALKTIIDYQNNLGVAAGNPEFVLAGGTFSADPTAVTSYGGVTIKAGFEMVEYDGTWAIEPEKVAEVSGVRYATFEEAVNAAKAGDTIKLLMDVTLAEELTLPAGITLNGNGKQINGTIYAGGDLTIEGHVKVTSFSASYYDRVITIGPGACFEVTGGGRVSLAYGNVFNITGTIENAKTADKTTIQPSLIIPGGISVTGGSDATFNVTNAYVVIGSTSSKNSSADGTFELNFTNSIAEFTNQFTMAEPTSGKTPTFIINIKDSVFTTGTKFIMAAPNSKVVVDNSVVTLGTYFRNSGEMTIKNGSVFTGATIQFGENGGNNGKTVVDNSTLTITASSAGHALDGKGVGSIVLQNGAVVSVDYYKDLTVEVGEGCQFITAQ